MTVNKWDWRFLNMLENEVKGWSKDPSTQTAALVAQGKDVVGFGFNGFPPRMRDDEERYADREFKYKFVLHAEDNALHYAGERAKGGTLYVVGLAPCCHCASLILRSGIERVVIWAPEVERWRADNSLALSILGDARITWDWVIKENNDG